jgi:putative ABC transport system ATP-binding protein
VTAPPSVDTSPGTSASPPKLTVAGLRINGPRTALIEHLDLQLRSGEILVVTGPPASGKSALLAVLAGQRTPAGGSVELDGRPVEGHAARREIGYAATADALLETLTAVETVALPLLARGVDAVSAWRRADAQLERVGLPAAVRNNLTEQLSGGQRQRVLFARATVDRPRLLVADDPTSELDAASAALVTDVLSACAADGAIVVLASTDPAAPELGRYLRLPR